MTETVKDQRPPQGEGELGGEEQEVGGGEGGGEGDGEGGFTKPELHMILAVRNILSQ